MTALFFAVNVVLKYFLAQHNRNRQIMAFFNKLNSTVQKAVNGAQQVVGDLSGSQSANSASNNTSHTMYEVFAPKFGIGRKFIFTENSLIYGDNEYKYSELTQIFFS